MATSFPSGGTRKGHTAMFSEDEIKTGRGKGPIELPVHESYESLVKGLRYWFGWTVPFAEAGAQKPKLPPAPSKAGYAGSGVDPEILAGAKAYADISRDIHRDGYRIVEPPENEMVYRFGNREGYERGSDIYVAKEMHPSKKVKVAWHEWRAKQLQKETGMSHEALHPWIIREQDAGAQSYLSRAARALFG